MLETMFKSALEQDVTSVVMCDFSHTIIYMNPAAIANYSKYGGAALLGKNLLDCHAPESREKIKKVIAWFLLSPENNRIFTFHNARQNKDVYMVALRDEEKRLIGYYEKHEYRTKETALPYQFA